MVWGRDELEGVPTLESGVEQQDRGASQGHHISGRNTRRTVVGFLNVLTGKLVRTVRQRGRGEDIAAGVQTLGDARVRRLLIWDNAPPHQARVARGAAEALGIEIVKLPFSLTGAQPA